MDNTILDTEPHNWLTPQIRILLTLLTAGKVVKKFPAFCLTHRSITMFTKACYQPPSEASWQSAPSQPLFLTPNLILSSRLRLVLSKRSFYSSFPTKICYTLHITSTHAVRPPTSFSFPIFGDNHKIIKLLIVQFCLASGVFNPLQSKLSPLYPVLEQRSFMCNSKFHKNTKHPQHTKTNKVIPLYILTSLFFCDSIRENKILWPTLQLHSRNLYCPHLFLRTVSTWHCTIWSYKTGFAEHCLTLKTRNIITLLTYLHSVSNIQLRKHTLLNTLSTDHVQHYRHQ